MNSVELIEELLNIIDKQNTLIKKLSEKNLEQEDFIEELIIMQGE